MHLRAPSIDHGVTSFLWGVFFGVLIWLGGAFVGYDSGITFITGAVAGFLIFVFVRVYGEDEPRRPLRADEREHQQVRQVAAERLLKAIEGARPLARVGSAVREEKLYSPVGVRRESGHVN